MQSQSASFPDCAAPAHQWSYRHPPDTCYVQFPNHPDLPVGASNSGGVTLLGRAQRIRGD